MIPVKQMIKFCTHIPFNKWMNTFELCIYRRAPIIIFWQDETVVMRLILLFFAAKISSQTTLGVVGVTLIFQYRVLLESSISLFPPVVFN